MAAQRTRGERERDRANIAQWYCEGVTFRKMVEKLAEVYDGRKFSLSTIAADIQTVREAWRDSMVADFGLRKAEELAKLDQIEVNAWECYRRSLEDRTHQAQEEYERQGNLRADGTRERVLTQRRVKRLEKRDGNAAFLELAMRCVSKRCEILGLNEPSQIALVDAEKTGMAHMIAMAQNADRYVNAENLLPPEAYGPGAAQAEE